MGHWRRRYQQKYLKLPDTWAYYLLLAAIFITLVVLATFLGIKVFQGGRAIQQRQRRNTLLKDIRRRTQSEQTDDHFYGQTEEVPSVPSVHR